MSMTRDFLDPIGVMPVVVLNNASDAVPVAQALYEGGIKAVEITLRTDAALESIEQIRKNCPDVIVGAGTVINNQQMQDVANAGVDFAVSPGMTLNLIQKANETGVKLLPGIATCSEIILGMEQGLSCFKLFPATAVGGLPLLKSIAGPLPQVSFCPTGGIKIDDFDQYLALPNVACVGGSWLVPAKAVAEKDWSAITRIAKETTSKIPR